MIIYFDFVMQTNFLLIFALAVKCGFFDLKKAEDCVIIFLFQTSVKNRNEKSVLPFLTPARILQAFCVQSRLFFILS